MTRIPLQATRRLFAALVVVVGAVAGSLSLSGPILAADSAATADKPAASKAEVEHLIGTLEDPAARQKLIGQLRLLVNADKADEPGLLPLISEQMQDVSDELLATATALSEVTHVAQWLNVQITDPRLRDRWTDILGKLVAILGGGILAERLFRLALAAPRRMLESRRPHDRWMRVPFAIGRWLLDLVPVGAFAAISYGLLALPLLKLTGDASLAAVLLITAYAVVRGGLVLVHALFMPGAGGIRVLPLDDETANYLFIWARRLTYTGIWGYFAIQAFKLLGLPKSGYNFSIKLLGLVVSTLLVILVLQNRQTVARWIRSRGEASGLSGRLKGLPNRLADIWHILAALYIIASFAIWALQVKGGFEFVVRASLLTVVILLAANVLAGLLAKLVNRAFAISEELRSQFPSLEARANRYLAIMHNVVRAAVWIGTVLAVGQAWGADTLAWLGSDLGRRLVSSTLAIAAVLIGALIVWELVSSSIERYLSRTDGDGNVVERSSRARTLLPLMRNVVLVVLVVFVALIVLSELGVNIAPLLAGAGVVGVAIGFGSQKLVQDVITGAFILFEDTIAVGDSVKIGDHTGTVEGMTIRTMRLREQTGHVHTIPFSAVASVTNMSRDFGYYVFDLGVSYREDVDQVMATIRAVGEDMQLDPEIGGNVDAVEVFGVDRFADSAVIIRGRFKTPPGKQWTVGREFNRRIKKRFDEAGIEIPYPTSTLYFGEDREGKAPPARVLIEPTADPVPPKPGPASEFAADGANYPIGETERIE